MYNCLIIVWSMIILTQGFILFVKIVVKLTYFVRSNHTVCPGSSDPPEKILNMFASENEVDTIF